MRPRIIFGWSGEGIWSAVRPCILEKNGSVVTREHGLPALRGDTLWFPVEELEITEERSKCRGGYECRLNVRNTADTAMSFGIVYPDCLPGGGRIIRSGNLDGLPPLMMLYPGVSISLPYRIVFESAKF